MGSGPAEGGVSELPHSLDGGSQNNPLTIAPKGSKRITSKRLLYGNTFMGWVLAFYGTYQGSEVIVTSALTFLLALYGTYTGIGHLDLRKMKE